MYLRSEPFAIKEHNVRKNLIITNPIDYKIIVVVYQTVKIGKLNKKVFNFLFIEYMFLPLLIFVVHSSETNYKITSFVFDYVYIILHFSIESNILVSRSLILTTTLQNTFLLQTLKANNAKSIE